MSLSKLETKVTKLEALAGDPEPERIELIWERDREPGPGELVITWQREGLGDEPVEAS